MRFAVMIQNTNLRKYESMPVTFIPGFDSFSIEERFKGRSDFTLIKHLKKFLLIKPLTEKINYNFDID